MPIRTIGNDISINENESKDFVLYWSGTVTIVSRVFPTERYNRDVDAACTISLLYTGLECNIHAAILIETPIHMMKGANTALRR